MQPARYDFTLIRGDSATLAFRLSRLSGSALVPLDISDSTIDLEIAWPGGSIEKSTADGGLAVVTGTTTTEVAWAATPDDTASVPAGAQSEYRLTRTSIAGGRRTYLTGLVSGLGRAVAGAGDVLVGLVVNDSAITFAVTVVDPGLSAAGVLAQVLGGADAAHSTLKKLGDLIAGLGVSDISGLAAALSGKASQADIASAINALKAGAGPAYDTLVKLQNIIVTDETAASALAALVATKVGAADLATALATANARSFSNALIFG